MDMEELKVETKGMGRGELDSTEIEESKWK